MTVFYNENNPYAAQWLRNLVSSGYITNGVVDDRSIKDLSQTDLSSFQRVHMFAGIGVWDYALELAGWPHSGPVVWTGSCPCQSFSVAGKRRGFNDERHLWPDWFRLIKERRPPVIFGEQVAGKDGLGWLNLVRTYLEGAGYAFGAADLPAAGVGAPHKRQRLFFCAYTSGERLEGLRLQLRKRRPLQGVSEAGRGGEVISRAYADGFVGGQGSTQLGRRNSRGDAQAWPRPRGSGGALHRHNPGQSGLEGHFGDVRDGRGPGWLDQSAARSAAEAGATRGFWGGCDWYYCRDGKYRPIGASLFPLANRAPTRVGPGGTLETQPRKERLHGFGNAIVPQVAATFVRAFMDVMSETQ